MQPLMAQAERITRACAAAILLGCAMHNASAEDTERFTIAGGFIPASSIVGDDRAFTKAIAWAVPISEVAALFDLIPGGYDWRSPGLMVDVWSAPGERARVEAFAVAWMYVYRQPAIPYFRTPEAGTGAMRLRYEPNLVAAHPWRSEAGDDGLLRVIRGLHPSSGIESRLPALRARYDAAVSRWLARRPIAGSPSL